MTTKEEPLAKKPNHQLAPHKKHLGKFVGTALLAGIMAVPMVFPRSVRAQDATGTVTTEQKQALIQNIPIKTIQQCLDDANKYKADFSKYPGDLSNRSAYVVDLSDSTGIMFNFMQSEGKIAPADEAGTFVLVTVEVPNKSFHRYDISLSELRTAYKQFSGQELKYFRGGVKIEKDGSLSAGELAELIIVPVRDKDGPIEPGTPIAVAQAWNDGAGAIGCDNSSHLVISMK
jgi:hypothetical protein